MPSTESAYAKNRKRYPNIKSRYLEPGRAARQQDSAGATVRQEYERKRAVLDRVSAKIDEITEPGALRVSKLSLVDAAYLDMIEADGRLDGAAAALGYLLAADDERTGGRQRHRWPEHPWVGACKALIRGNGSPVSLVRAACAFMSGGDGRDRWTWAVDMLLEAAMAILATDHGDVDKHADGDSDGGRDRATCLFVFGRYYATATATEQDDRVSAVRLLDSARRLATQNRDDWLLPSAVLDATGVRHMVPSRRLWAAACYAESQVLLDMASELDPDEGLWIVKEAYRLTKPLSGEDSVCRTAAAYELGVRYVAADVLDMAAEAFRECAAVAGPNSDMDLEALIQMCLTVDSETVPGERILRRVAENALHRRNGRLLIKAIVAQGRIMLADGPDVANRNFMLADRLASTVKADDEDVELAQIYTAAYQTYEFMRDNFPQLSEEGFDLTAARWTEFDGFRDSEIEARTLDVCRLLNLPDELCEREIVVHRLNDSDSSEGSTLDEEDQIGPEKKHVSFLPKDGDSD